jgi:hypothetical protein
VSVRAAAAEETDAKIPVVVHEHRVTVGVIPSVVATRVHDVKVNDLEKAKVWDGGVARVGQDVSDAELADSPRFKLNATKDLQFLIEVGSAVTQFGFCQTVGDEFLKGLDDLHVKRRNATPLGRPDRKIFAEDGIAPLIGGKLKCPVIASSRSDIDVQKIIAGDKVTA